MKKRYYIAYGSNLNRRQMKLRCPGSKAVGKAVIEGYRLVFKGSGTGAYLTIEPFEGGRVPVGIYSVTEDDEAALDRYEGFPRCYHKEDMTLTASGMRGGKPARRKAFVYIMDERRGYGIPSQEYMDICCEGYAVFGFDLRCLQKAYEDSEEEVWKRISAG